jgi:hypothetical protein
VLAIIDAGLVMARPLQPSGYTYTLASRLGQMLHQAEVEYGQRDRSYTLLGVEFRDGVPQVWFPENRKDVVVQLGLGAMQDPVIALFQLAHEVIHLLDPRPGAANYLEEGVAADFQQRFIRSVVGHELPSGDPNYDRARALLHQFTTLAPNAVRSLRQTHGPMRSVTEQQIVAAVPGVTPDLASQLASPFP